MLRTNDIFKKASFKSREIAMINCQSKITPSLTNLKGKTMLHTGIDFHIALCTVNDSETGIARTKIKTDPQTILTYLHQWSEPHKVTVECTRWKIFSSFLVFLQIIGNLRCAKLAELTGSESRCKFRHASQCRIESH